MEETRSPLNPRQDQCRSKDPMQMHDMHMLRAACFGRARARDEHLSETEALREENS